MHFWYYLHSHSETSYVHILAFVWGKKWCSRNQNRAKFFFLAKFVWICFYIHYIINELAQNELPVFTIIYYVYSHTRTKSWFHQMYPMFSFLRLLRILFPQFQNGLLMCTLWLKIVFKKISFPFECYDIIKNLNPQSIDYMDINGFLWVF